VIQKKNKRWIAERNPIAGFEKGFPERAAIRDAYASVVYRIAQGAVSAPGNQPKKAKSLLSKRIRSSNATRNKACAAR
jgi:hypothetical protein